MREIIVKTQEELDQIKEVKVDEYVIIKAELQLNSVLPVYGKLRLEFRLDCSWGNRYIVARENSSVVARENSSVVAWGNSSVVARENSSVVARENSSVVAWENSSVVAWGNSSVVVRENSSVVVRENSSVEARENSSVEAWENSSVEAWENSSVEVRGNSSVVARENSSVVARENSSVVAWGNSSVVARENSSVVARENSSVEAWENSSVKLLYAIKKVILYGFSVCWKPFDLDFKVEKKSKYAYIQEYKDLGWLERNGIEKKLEVILYKKVSKDFKTQENTPNETLWKIGSIVECKNWQPQKSECGDGKFHAVSRPYFADGFRNVQGDKYIAVEIALKDLYEWKDEPDYPHKIGFRKGKVLYECDRFGKQLTP
jgi:hypothetical protein